MTGEPGPLPSFDDVKAAAGRLAGKAEATPLLSSAALNERTGGRVLLKAECLQRTGSFKFRGAYNALACLDESGRANGVVTCSSGNHAQGVAAAAALFGIPATIVMPEDAPALKRQRTEALGARIVPYDRATGDRDAMAQEIRRQTGAAFVAPYDDPAVIAGQGTTGMELLSQAEAMGATPDIVLVPASGGGLLAGIALAVAALSPGTEVVSVEPEGFDDHARSFPTGRRVENSRRAGSICDALLAQLPGELTFEINRKLVAGGLSVSDDDALAAMAYAWRELKLVVEPGGAVALASVLSGKIDVKGRTVAIVLSGGNADAAIYAQALAIRLRGYRKSARESSTSS